MADEFIEFEARGADKVADAYRKVGDAAKDTGDKVEESGEKSEKAGKSSSNLTKTLGKLTAAYTLVKEGIIDAVAEGAKLEASQSRLASSMRRANVDARGQAQILKAASDSTARFGVKAADANDMLARLVATTEDAAKATELYSLAQDIASQESSVDLAQATELLVKAQKGEVEELKNLNGLTKDQAAALGQIKDEAFRSQVAIQILTDEYYGLAEANRGTEDDIASFAAGMNNLQAALGRIIIESGKSTTMLLEMTGVLDDGEFSVNNIAGAFDNFADAIANTTANMRVFMQEATIEERVLQGVSMTPLGLVLTAAGVTGADEKFREVVARGGGTAAGAGGGGGKRPDGRPAMSPDAFYGPTMDQAGFDPNAKKKRGPRRKADEGPGLDDLDFGGFRGDFDPAEQELEREVTRIQEEEQRKRAESLQKHLDEQQAAREEHAEMRLELKEEEEALALKAQEEAQKSRAAALQAAGDAAASIAQSTADQFIESEAAKAVISAAIESARSIAAFATGNIPGGIAHAAAAAQFSIAAAAAGKQAAGGTGRGASRTDSGQRAREDVGLLGEQSRAQFRQDASPLVVNINSAFPPSPEQARALASAVERDRGTRI